MSDSQLLAIVPASGPASRAHLALSIERAIDPELCSRYFSEDLLGQVDRENHGEGFFAWGATPGPSNSRNWERLSPGTFVLFYQGGRYTRLSRVIAKERSEGFARELWGSDDDGATWELMYFLRTPTRVDAPTELFTEFLPARFQGFTVVPEARVERIIAAYGSLEEFIERGVRRGSIEAPQSLARAYWWVNQGQTYRQEREGGYLWAPERTKSGITVSHHSNVKLIKPDDLIFHYSQGALRAISLATEEPRPSPRLSELPAESWEAEGNIARTAYYDLLRPIRLEEIPKDVRRGGPNSPFGQDGNVKQGYLFRAPDELVRRLHALFGDRWPPGLPSGVGGDELSARTASLGLRVNSLRAALSDRGMVYQPWQIAAYVTAVRTKPFVVLAGVSGTGKTKLPRLVAEATGSSFQMAPVKPDWTDSTELLGYETLTNAFRPGSLLQAALEAQQNPNRQHFFLLDEMNLARVEYYFAEVLSHMEERFLGPEGSWVTAPLVRNAQPDETGALWNDVPLPPNLCVVGSVNMDETTHGFSRKVLDRAFVLEFSEIDLTQLPSTEDMASSDWSSEEWQQVHRSIGEVPADYSTVVKDVITALTEINEILRPLQLQVGYRVRDEIALFCVNARDCIDSFVNFEGQPIAPLDLGVSMKVLPRIQGGSRGVQKALQALQEWSARTSPGYPVCGDRLRLMRERYEEEGFTSFWL